MYNVKLTSKTLIECNIKDLVDVLNSKTELYLKHVYSTGHQLKFIEDLKLHLEYKEVFVVIDFSENYLCKYNSEIQSVHFGASKKQISLHTGAFFYRDLESHKINCVSFCTISECLRHDAPAVWAHMQPILDMIKSLTFSKRWSIYTI